MSNQPKRRFDPQQHKYIVDDAVSKMKFVKDAKSASADPVNQLLDKLAHCITDVHVIVRPILKAGGGFDTEALKRTIFTNVREQMIRFSKDEMEALLTIMISEQIEQDVSSNPSGSDKGPDLLGGK